jgi:hypothetical protein
MHGMPTRQDGRLAGNNAALVRLALLLGLGVAMALIAPDQLFAATLSSFLGLAALGVAVSALVAREAVWQPHLTRWDVAAWLHGLALLAGFFVEPDAVRQFLAERGGQMP